MAFIGKNQGGKRGHDKEETNRQKKVNFTYNAFLFKKKMKRRKCYFQ